MPREILLGLGDPPIRRYLYVSQDESDAAACWYEFNLETKLKIPVPQRALTGYVTGLKLHEVSSRFGKKWKLDILMDCGRDGTFAIRSGINTTFTRGVVLSMLAIPEHEQLKEALTIVVSPSADNQKIVFGAVYLAENGARVKFEWDKTADLANLVTFLQSVVGDGGQVDSETDPEEAPGATNGNGNGSVHHEREPTAPRVERPAGLASSDQLKELKRVAVSKGLTTIEADVLTLDVNRLNDACDTNYPGRTIEELTVAEAIEFRRTLMSLGT